MVFNNFGAPLYENFDNHSTTSVSSPETEPSMNQMQVALTEIEYDFDCVDKIEKNGHTYCRRAVAPKIEAFQNNNEDCITNNDGKCGKDGVKAIMSTGNKK